MNNFHNFEAGYILSQIWQYFAKVNISFIILLIIVFSIAFVVLYIFRKLWVLKVMLQQEKVFLELTPPALTEKTSYTTQQLFSVLHTIGTQRSIIDKLLGKKVLFSFEIVSTKTDGIRYVIQTTQKEVDIVQKTIRSYLPYVRVKTVSDYFSESKKLFQTKTLEFKLKKHFAFPLAKQNVLDEHDPVAYITGMMTKLRENELIAFQIVVSPAKKLETYTISQKILRNEDVLGYLNKPRFPVLLQPFNLLFLLITKLLQGFTKMLEWTLDEFTNGSSRRKLAAYQFSYQQNLLTQNNLKPARVLSAFEQDAVLSIQEKVDQSLFETMIRAYILVEKADDLKQRVRGIKSSLAPFSIAKYQSVQAKHNFPSILTDKIRVFSFKNRLLSTFTNQSSEILSISEISDLYHFPFAKSTQTENIAKTLSRELPAPLSLKKDRELMVVFGENTYGGTTTQIGLTKEERETHMYIIGRTGSGKTTLMFSMAQHDIEKGNGMAFVDPHGDISEDLLASIPKERINDLVYLNPIDLKYPIGINLLELTPGLDEDETELEKEVVCEGVISLFRKVFSKEENINAHRIEYILRNAIYTAFTTENPTLFTIYELLNNPPFQKQVISKLTDENLKNFWKFEFGRAGNYQVVKMVGGVTAKVGRFLFSPTAKRILEQKKSTINFDEIMNEGKILLCNFSQGNLGEDTARLLGTTVLTKLQQAALRRARLPKDKRKPFYLYVDEFQNFATHAFIKMLSEGRKYGLSVCIAEQSTSQQDDKNIVHTILANVTTVVCFRSANPIDEQLMLAQFAPYVEKGDITNLPRYQFYIKISATEPEEPFSGKTLFTPIEKDQEKMQRLIQASRDNFAIVYERKKIEQKKITVQKSTNDQTVSDTTGDFPEV